MAWPRALTVSVVAAEQEDVPEHLPARRQPQPVGERERETQEGSAEPENLGAVQALAGEEPVGAERDDEWRCVDEQHPAGRSRVHEAPVDADELEGEYSAAIAAP